MNLLIASLVVLLLVGVLLSGRASVYKYKIDRNALVVSFFDLFDLYSIPYADMSDARVARFWDHSVSGWMPLLLKNRFAIDVVVISRGDGFFRKIVLTPRLPYNFVAELLLARDASIAIQGK